MFSNVWLADDEDEKRHGQRALDGIPQNAAARSVRVGFLEKAHWISSICSVFVLVDAGCLRNSQRAGPIRFFSRLLKDIP